MKYYLLFLGIFYSQVLIGQVRDEQLISVELRNAPVSEFVSTLEAKTNYHFYYDPKVMDSLRVTLKSDQKTLSVILNEAFKGTAYAYTISQEQEVFLARSRNLRTVLAPGYFVSGTDSTVQYTAAATGNYADLAGGVIEATIENKLYEIGLKTNTLPAGNLNLSGYMRDIKTGEPAIGGSIYVAGPKIGTTSDSTGFYSINLPAGKHVLSIRGVGLKTTVRQVMLYAPGKLNIELQEQVLSLREVRLSAQKNSNTKAVEMGVSRLDIKAIKQVPVVFGEADVLRVVLTLPGVKSVGEATTGFNVRGGSADQNLIQLNNGNIYNPAHFFGFFSAFNPDMVKAVELYKSTIPEKFGGRISSVLDVTNREGNKKKFTGTAGIGLITSRVNIEGPIDSNRTSFIAGFRTTYSNWLLGLLPDETKNSKASFSDINLGISHQANATNNLYLALYYSTDKFKLNSDTSYGYSNKNGSLKWKHDFSKRFSGTFIGGFDRYEYGVGSVVNPVNGYQLGFNINQTNLKSDFTHYLNNNNTLNFGLATTYYRLHPGRFSPSGIESLVVEDRVPSEQALESAVYFGDKFDLSSNLSFSAGIRYSLYSFLGPQTVRNYAPNLPKNDYNLLDSTRYGAGKPIRTYSGPEIRLSGRYNVSGTFSVKASYNTLYQYIHLLSNTTAIAPTDVWKLSDANIRPQHGSQVSLGLYKNLNGNGNVIETSVEVYYKRLTDYLDYKTGAQLVLNHHVETDVVGTRGKAYGAEFSVRKNSGKLNGWMSYTYSRTFLKMDDPTVGTPINGGNYYPANYDKPHDMNVTGNYRFSHRYSISLNMTYSTGRPITLPIARYTYGGSDRVYYSDRNANRIPDYFRTDFSLNIEGNHKVKQLTHNSWTAGVYNLTGRQNPYSVYFTSETGAIKGYKLSIFARALPYINYNIRF